MKAGAKKAFVRTTGAVALGASSMSLAFPALAFASEEESGGISAILPNMTEFIPMLVCFIILVVVLGKPRLAEVRRDARKARADHQGVP